MVTLAIGGSAETMVVQIEKFAKAECKAADLKSQDEYKSLGDCKEENGQYQMFSCSGSVPTMSFYNDSACTEAADAQDVAYSGDKVCMADGGPYMKRTCVSRASLGTYAQYSKSTCEASSLLGQGQFSGASCRMKADWKNNAWEDESEKIVLSSDAMSITSTKHKSMDCSGAVDGDAGIYQCGTCFLPEGDDKWMVLNFPGCGPSLASGAVARAPTFLTSVALMLAKIVCM